MADIQADIDAVRKRRVVHRPHYKAENDRLEKENLQLYQTLETHLKEIERLRDLAREQEKRIEFLSSTDAQDALLDQLSEAREQVRRTRLDNTRLRKLAETLFPLAVNATPLLTEDTITETGDWA